MYKSSHQWLNEDIFLVYVAFYGQDCEAYLDFFDELAAMVVFPVSAGLFEPAWSFSLNDETCFKDNDDYCTLLSGGYVHNHCTAQ